MGWSIEYDWDKLSPVEQEIWIVNEENRMQQISELADWLTQEKDDGKKTIDGVGYALIQLIGNLS